MRAIESMFTRTLSPHLICRAATFSLADGAAMVAALKLPHEGD
jgi:hypothetical protein